jgi:hypothetical protein
MIDGSGSFKLVDMVNKLGHYTAEQSICNLLWIQPRNDGGRLRDFDKLINTVDYLLLTFMGMIVLTFFLWILTPGVALFTF